MLPASWQAIVRVAAARRLRPALRRNSEPRAWCSRARSSSRGVRRRHRDMVGAGQGHRHRLGRRWRSYFGVTMFYFRVPFYDVVILSADWTPAHDPVAARHDAGDQPDRRSRRPGRRHRRDRRGAFFLYAQPSSTSSDLLDEPNIGPLIAIIAAGMCVGFLPHNFNPARIFMGDGGVPARAADGGLHQRGRRAGRPEHPGVRRADVLLLRPAAIPLLILGVPILDTLFAIVRRATRRQALDEADKGHLHHRLMNLGHGQRRSVLILWTWTALLSAFVLYPVLTGENPTYLPFGIGALGIVLFTVFHPSVRRGRRSTSTSAGWNVVGHAGERRRSAGVASGRASSSLCERSQAPVTAAGRAHSDEAPQHTSEPGRTRAPATRQVGQGLDATSRSPWCLPRPPVRARPWLGTTPVFMIGSRSWRRSASSTS
jgi:hypothetical protein